MAEGMSVADAMALSRGNDGFLEGNGIIILILFFLIFGFGGNFGGNSNALTQAELQTGLYNQTTDRNLSDIKTAQCSTDNLINVNAMNTNNAIAESKYENLIQFKDLMASNDRCCCELKSTIIEQNQATRDLIQANYISGLQTALSDMKDENSNLRQTNTILNTTGRWVGYAGCGSCSYNNCGCNSII